MGTITLPHGSSNSGTNDWADVHDNDDAILDTVNGDLDNSNLSATAGIVGSKLDTTDGRLKQTTGLVVQSANLALTTSWADITGATVTFTPDVACYALVTATMGVDGLASGKYAGMRLMVDGVAETAEGYAAGSDDYSSTTQVYRVALSAAAHTLKLQAIRSTDGCNATAAHTRFLYMLIAQ